MTPTLLHINDIALCIENQDSQLWSPGFAIIKDDEIAFGNTAIAMHRLYPLDTHNNFWTRFDQNPIQSNSKHIRHNADLAFMHLSDIQENFKQVNNWLIAVPSDYGRDELALLLGLLNAAKFKNVKLIDAALLASSSVVQTGAYTYIDLQLHQTVLTKIQSDSETKVLDSQNIQNVNMLSIEKSIEKIISDELISQSRFDSHHNAETEQLLYNKLSEVISALENNSSYGLEIEYHGHTHQAIINQEPIREALTPLYSAIEESIDKSSTVILNPFLHSLPGCKDYFHSALIIEKESVFKSLQQYSEFISSTADDLNYLTSLPNIGHQASANKKEKTKDITHILIDNHAIALNGQAFKNDDYAIYYKERQYWLKANQDKDIYLNGNKVDSDASLQLGDEIRIANQTLSNRLICVD